MTVFLKPLGFKKSGRAYNRGTEDGLVHVFGLRTSNGLQIRNDGLHLISRQVFDDTMHHRRRAKYALNHEQLFEQIGGMLSSKARKRSIALRLRTMTGRAGWDLSSRHALCEDSFALSNERRITALASGG
jgi:hypothetical protein